MQNKKVLVVDDEWLGMEDDVPPPHLYICLANKTAAFRPVTHASEHRSTTGHVGFDALVGDEHDLQRLEGHAADLPGAWLVRRGA